jgi:hypothetical protein
MTMTIVLTDADPEVEALLKFLDAKTHLSLYEKRAILMRTQDWLQRMDGVEYPSATVEVKASLGDVSLLLPSRLDNIPRRGQLERVCPKVGK